MRLQFTEMHVFIIYIVVCLGCAVSFISMLPSERSNTRLSFEYHFWMDVILGIDIDTSIDINTYVEIELGIDHRASLQ